MSDAGVSDVTLVEGVPVSGVNLSFVVLPEKPVGSIGLRVFACALMAGLAKCVGVPVWHCLHFLSSFFSMRSCVLESDCVPVLEGEKLSRFRVLS